jgi:hypothetical protein
MRKKLIALLALTLPAILLGTVLATTQLQADPHTQALLAFHRLSIRYVGGTNPLFNKMVTQLQSMTPTQMSRLDPSKLTLSDLSSLGTSSSLVMFDGDYLNSHKADASVKSLLHSALAGTRIVTVGGTTSTLFDLLNQNGIYHIFSNPDGTPRNPDNFNAPQAGFCFKNTVSSNGTPYSFPSILTSNSNDPATLANALADWSLS